jgi:hypothetical protein
VREMRKRKNNKREKIAVRKRIIVRENSKSEKAVRDSVIKRKKEK